MNWNKDTKLVLFVGEYHNYEQQIIDNKIKLLSNFFNSFKKIHGMIIDLFFEVEHNRHELNMDGRYGPVDLFPKAFELFSNYENVRFH